MNMALSLFLVTAALSLTAPLCEAQTPCGIKGLDLLAHLIAQYNTKAISKSLRDDTYKGEAGILRVGPETGREFGLRVTITENYRLASKLSKEAQDIYQEIVDGLKEPRPGGLGKKRLGKLLDLCISYNSKKRRAVRLFAAYREEVRPEKDQRLDKDLCKSVMQRELALSLEKQRLRVRDALADFFNRTYKGQSHDPPLTPENVDFVNSIFRDFVKRASPEIKKGYDFDSFLLKKDSVKPGVWKMIFPPRLRAYGEIVERLYLRMGSPRYRVHPVLFMALMRRESNFDPIAVSDVGAVGLTQIMPSTAKLLGMKSVYAPSYLPVAGEYLRKARQWRSKALGLVQTVDRVNGREKIRKAWYCMQESIKFAEKSKTLFRKYERELLNAGKDDRLDVEKAIEHGYKYFTRMLNRYKGDISLALAAYNAGPNRIRQFGGIPPFPETVAFRNTVLKYYYEYLSQLSVVPGGEDR